ncbi:putative bifunctional diguanylate cyclase/phosphodiesterase [Massilia norwichensis]|uniref:EAL domain-containing protein n=1 Tax=Massilia norwichensis TaxID=1442366 RepID=A0ABT2A5Z0_9BURK|nr:GGDEF and EAL domain-containing protein [Massilia norwichensis]MCS0589606.1 EAL domain-containing protein [Massilia norwichensis]
MLEVRDIASWRERIFSSLLSVVLVVGALATLPVIPFLVQQGLWPVAVADTIALAWIFAIWRLGRLSYTVRVMHFLAVVYALAITLMLSVGTASMTYLLGPPVIAAILLSLRPAMLALALGAVLLVALGNSGHVTFSVPGWQHEPFKASLLAALNYIGVGAMLTLTCGTLLKGLSRSLGDAHTLNGELQLTSAALARLNDMVLITRAVEGENVTQPVTFVNDAFLRRTGYTRSEILGHSLRVLLGPQSDQAAVGRIVGAMRKGQPCNTELMSYTKAGEPFWVEIEMVPFAPPGARASHWVIVGRDITQQRQAAEAIHRLAFYDVLTGLANRRLLVERLEAMVEAANAGRGLGALLYLDLDNFKNVNDARGHSTGDALLRHAAARLLEAVRDCDTVARIGGDEFVVLIGNLPGDADAATRTALAMADQIRAALAAPLDIDGHGFRIAASIGIALPLDAGATADALLLEADTAMYHAKAGGRDSVALFARSMLRDAQQKLTLEHDLGQALDRGELAMHLQLQVDHAGTPAGAELLMRWTRADGSMVPPDVFIPVAEAGGLIVPLGQWALRQACAAWLALDAAGHRLPLSLNVSPLQFRQPDFVEQVRAVLAETGAPPQQLIFEVTEGLLIDDIDQTVARMRALSELGIRFSIDDFGTGYSNLSYLKRLPLYELKIDKSLVRDMPHDQNGTAIVQSVLAMARHLGLRVVAEGIETAEQAAFLAAHGRPYMQGYLFSRPVALGALLDQMDARADLAA